MLPRLARYFFLLIILSCTFYYCFSYYRDRIVALPQHEGNETQCTVEARITHLVVPFHAKQANKIQEFLNGWIKYPPCASLNPPQGGLANVNCHPRMGEDVELIFFIGSMNNTKEIEQKVMDMYYGLPQDVRKCFGSVGTRSQKLGQTDNSYMLGAKSMFEKFLNNSLLFTKEPFYAFYMEPDVRPVRAGWLSWVDAQCRWPAPKFWVKGSQFRGEPLLRRAKNIVTKLHINGNAIYNLRDREFKKFYFEMVLPFIKNAGHKPWLVAYDLLFMTFVLENYQDYQDYQKHLHKFVLSDFIQNRYHANYTVQEVIEESDSTYLIHGGQQIAM
jgi:hypothetical protein